MKKLAILFILYKQKVRECETFHSLCRSGVFENENFSCLIWDNSPYEIDDCDKSIISKFDIKYIHTSENQSLAKIYNKYVELYYNNCELLVFLDQDSSFTEQYIREITIQANENPEINLFVPIIKVQTGIIFSPARFLFPGKGRKLRNVNTGINTTKKFAVIMSGIVLRSTFFKQEQFQFNENLQIYGVDTDFSVHFAKLCKEYFVLNYTFNHDLSSESQSFSKLDGFNRCKVNLKSLDYIYTSFPNKIFICLIKVYYFFYYIDIRLSQYIKRRNRRS